MPQLNPEIIAEKGAAIYKEKFQSELEQKYPGKFVAVDIASEDVVIADTPEDALTQAQQKYPGSYFHLIKIGSAGVYRVGYSRSNSRDWLFR